MTNRSYILVAGLLFLFSGNSQAQEWFPIPVDWDDSTKVEVGFGGQFTYQSDHLTSNFMNKFVYGGEIDSITRYEISSSLEEMNYAGAQWSYGAHASVYNDSIFGQYKWGWQIGLMEYNQINMKFHRDAYDLIFLGNKKFEGDTAHIMNSSLNQLQFDKLSFGLFDKESGSNISVSLIGGKSFSEFYIDAIDLFTDTLGQELQMDFAADVSRSDTTPGGYFNFNGWGVGIDLNYFLKVTKDTARSGLFLISVQNLGFINWNNQSLYFKKDTSINYVGFESTDLFDTDVSFFGEGESINDTLGWEYVKRSSIRPLPASVSITKVPDPDCSHRLQSIFGIRMLLASNYRPLAFLGAHYQLHDQVGLALTGAFGGYGGYRIGFRGDIRTGQNDFLSFGISNLSSFMRVNNNGMAAFATYKISF